MYLVTGGAGFIGSNVVAALCERGERVAVCDRLGDGAKWRNLCRCELWDLVPPEGLQGWLDVHGADVQAIVHLGAISSTLVTDVDLIAENNLRLSLYLWRWCTARQKRLVYASSAATYGAGEHGFDDDFTPQALSRLRPCNPYAWSKHLFDRYVARASHEGSCLPQQWAGLKFFNVYGPNEYHKGPMRSVVEQSHASISAGRAVTLFRSHRPEYPDGGQLRDFIYVSDCVGVILWLLDNPAVNGIFNVGTGEARSFLELARAVGAAVGRSPEIQFIDMPDELRPRYQYLTVATLDRLRNAGYTTPFTRLEEGVHEYIERYLAQPDRYR